MGDGSVTLNSGMKNARFGTAKGANSPLRAPATDEQAAERDQPLLGERSSLVPFIPHLRIS